MKEKEELSRLLRSDRLALVLTHGLFGHFWRLCTNMMLLIYFLCTWKLPFFLSMVGNFQGGVETIWALEMSSWGLWNSAVEGLKDDFHLWDLEHMASLSLNFFICVIKNTIFSRGWLKRLQVMSVNSLAKVLTPSRYTTNNNQIVILLFKHSFIYIINVCRTPALNKGFGGQTRLRYASWLLGSFTLGGKI